MCVSAPNILASILHRATLKGENCFPCLVNIFFTESTTDFATSPSLSVSLCQDVAVRPLRMCQLSES